MGQVVSAQQREGHSHVILREGPNPKDKIIGEIPNGTVLQVLAVEEGVVQVQGGGKMGWAKRYNFAAESSEGSRSRSRSRGHGEPAAQRGAARGADPARRSVVFMEWNIFWKNWKHSEIARVCKREHDTPPDIIGFCELAPSNPGKLVSLIVESLNALLSDRTYVAQSAITGSRWLGFGADIVYNSSRFDCLEDGKVSVSVPGTLLGPRAANWVVLQEKSSGRRFITGGMHLSSGAPKHVHREELKRLYAKFNQMKEKYPTAPVIWMGDLNLVPTAPVVSDLMRGKIGSDDTFRVDNVVQTRRRTITHPWGRVEPVIDHILADKSVNIRRIKGGRADLASEEQKEYKDGTWLAGADHYPVFAELDW